MVESRVWLHYDLGGGSSLEVGYLARWRNGWRLYRGKSLSTFVTFDVIETSFSPSF